MPGPLPLTNPDGKPLVLIIDDSVDVHRLLGARLRSEHAQLLFAHSGREGIDLARKDRVATILLDLDMPGMDGFAVLRELKNHPETRNVPVIVVSGMSDSTDKVTAFEIGASDYVTKPFDMAELKARLRATIRLDTLLRLLAERAEVDGLTGLSNRASFNKHLAREVSETARHKHPLTLALLDLDHFKSINDTYGHPAGDEVLQRFAKVIQSSCRSGDIPCRYGGEEFALIMPQTAPGDAMVVTERIRQAIAQLSFPRHPERTITVSIGMVGVNADQGTRASVEQWIDGADKALYSSKHEGRNRVTTGTLPASDLKVAGAA